MSDDRRGFAMLLALWLVLLLAGAATGVLEGLNLAIATSRNRASLVRAAWARDACDAIVRERLGRSFAAGSGTIDLGRPLACRFDLHDPRAALNVNVATEAVLRGLFADPVFVDALLDWRDADDEPRANGAERAWYRAHGGVPPRQGPLGSLDELAHVRGFRPSYRARAESLLTVHGDGTIDPRVAPREVLAVLPGFGRTGAELAVGRRESGMATGDGSSGDASPAGGGARLLVARITGGVAGASVVATATVTWSLEGSHVARIRAEVE